MVKRDTRPPKVEFRAHEPLQDYFHDGKGGWYSVAKLALSGAMLTCWLWPAM